MSECERIHVRHKKLCIGDMDRRITIYNRTLNTPGNTVDYSNTMTNTDKVWAAAKTAKGRQMFYTTNEDRAVTHIFYIRHTSGVDSSCWVGYRGEYYDIVDAEDIDERNEWIALYCNVRGAATSGINRA